MPTRKARGAETERLVAAAWRAAGWPHAEVVRGPGADLTGTPGIAVECKARRGLDLPAWMRQAASRPGLPVLVVRLDGTGPATVPDWPAVVPQRVLWQLLRQAGYGTPIDHEGATT
jgi:hypothetical protein